MDPRIVLIDLWNPLSIKPADALSPYKALHPSGHCLVQWLRNARASFSIDDYLESFERFELWPGQQLPSGPEAHSLLRREGQRVLDLCTANSSRIIVCFGAKVWSSIVMRTPPHWFDYQFRDGSQFWYMPRPNMRNRLYNDHTRRERTAIHLLDLVDQERRVHRELALQETRHD